MKAMPRGVVHWLGHPSSMLLKNVFFIESSFLDISKANQILSSLQLASELEGIELQCQVRKMLIEGELMVPYSISYVPE